MNIRKFISVDGLELIVKNRKSAVIFKYDFGEVKFPA